jgi:hypothetical protein
MSEDKVSESVANMARFPTDTTAVRRETAQRCAVISRARPACWESVWTWLSGGSYIPSTPDSCLDADVAALFDWKDAHIAALRAERDRLSLELAGAKSIADEWVVQSVKHEKNLRAENDMLKTERDKARAAYEHVKSVMHKHEASLQAANVRVETLEAALGELVALKELSCGGAEAMRGGNYDARKPKAWASARAALSGKQ